MTGKWVTILGLTGVLSGPLAAGTCSLCREVLQSGGSSRLINGYYWSILILVAVPLVALAVGVRYAWKRYS